MSKPFIVLGDKTTHGGTVISADVTCDISGKHMARVTDKTVCPKCKGIFPIIAGAGDVVDGSGLAYARHLDETACGAKLLSGQVTTYWDAQSSAGAGSGSGSGAAMSSGSGSAPGSGFSSVGGSAGGLSAMAASGSGSADGTAFGDDDPPAAPAAVAQQTPTLCLECLATAAARGDAIVARG